MRKPKTPLAAWIVAQRRAQTPPWKAEELAERLGLSDSTVRGWEAGRSVSEENLAALERLFGLEAPGRDAPADQAGLILALTRQTETMERLVGAIERLLDEPAHLAALRERREAEEEAGSDPANGDEPPSVPNSKSA